MSPFERKCLLVGILVSAVAIPFNSLFAISDDQSAILPMQVMGYTAEAHHNKQE
ncbi:MAG: hypothetical protein OEY43_04985 [Gammaproteobacteria bacterium]|nr:hypothetical protein [Gammaproteobacteria bacterium]